MAVRVTRPVALRVGSNLSLTLNGLPVGGSVSVGTGVGVLVGSTVGVGVSDEAASVADSVGDEHPASNTSVLSMAGTTRRWRSENLSMA